MVRWPAKIKGGQTLNGIVSTLDWFPTFLAAAGDTKMKDKLLKGTRIGKKKAKVHLDGYNMLPYFTGKTKESPRTVFHYLDDEGLPVGVRIGDWKVVYAEQRAKTMALWAEPMVELRLAKLFNLRRDPYERADLNSNAYWDWFIDRAPWMYYGIFETSKFLASFKNIHQVRLLILGMLERLLREC